MSDEGSVTRWIHQLQSGDPQAAQHLWDRYFRRLVGLAGLKLRDAPRRFADEEDVALSAFDSFCRNAEQGQFAQLMDRDSLWRLLMVMTMRKAAHLMRDETRQKRGGGVQPLTDSAGQEDEDSLLAQILTREPTPEMAAQMAEEYHALLDRLADPELEQIALARMEGFSVEEIATRLNCVPRTIKRKLQLIRTIWEKESS